MRPSSTRNRPVTIARYSALMDGIGWAASAMAAGEKRLDIAAQNLANGSTDGFHRLRARGRLGAGGVRIDGIADERQGPLRHTGRPFDVAIVGAGAFTVRGPGARVSTTRNGAFSRDRFYRLVDPAGRVLMGARGAVHVPIGASIAPSGEILLSGRVVDRIPLQPHATVCSGFLEGSNVDSIGAMIELLSAARSFETAQKVLTSIDAARERLRTQVAVLK